jgi:uncharacterized membrane protein
MHQLKIEAIMQHHPWWRRRAFFWMLIFFSATALSWMTPPMQSPDEISHITRAYVISTGQFFLDEAAPEMQELAQRYAAFNGIQGYIERTRQHRGSVGAWVDEGLLDFADAYGVLPGISTRKLQEGERQHISGLVWSDKKKYYVMPGTNYYFPLIYAPHALGLAVGRAVGLRIEQTYRLTRSATLGGCLIMLALAFRRISPSPVVIAILLMPMSLFQFLSPTLDALTTSLALFGISIYHNAVDPRNSHTLTDALIFTASLVLLITTRNHLLPLLSLPFYIAWRRKSRLDLMLGCLVVCATLAWTLFVLQTTNDQRISRSHSTGDLLHQYAVNPLQFFQIVMASLQNSELFTFYQRSFIGILGALDVPLQLFYYSTLWGGLGLCAMASISLKSLRKDYLDRLMLIGAALASAACVFLALLVTWTPHPTNVVNGIQGRYFVIPALLIGLSLGGQSLTQYQSCNRTRMLLTIAFFILSLTAYASALLSHYHGSI